MCSICAWYKLVVFTHIVWPHTCIENDLADPCCKHLFMNSGMRVTCLYVMQPHSTSCASSSLEYFVVATIVS